MIPDVRGVNHTIQKMLGQRNGVVHGGSLMRVAFFSVLLAVIGAGVLAHAERAQSARVYDDVIASFTRNGVVDDETQRNDLMIIRQVAGVTDTIPNARAYDFSFALEADQQLNKANWRP